MSHVEFRKLTKDRDARPRRRLLSRLAGLTAVFIGLGTMGEASADWISLGKPSEFDGLTSRPTVGRNEDGRLELFVRGGDGALKQIWQTTSGVWSGWNNLGGFLWGNATVSNNLDGRLEVFLHGGDDIVYHRWQTTPNGDWDEFSPLHRQSLTGDPTVTRNWDGRMQIFVRGTDNSISHCWQRSPNIGWSDWTKFTDSIGDVNSNIAAIATNAGGGLNLFWRGADNRLRWKRQSVANGAWGRPRSLGGPTGGIASDIAVAEFDGQRSDPRLVVFVRGADNAIWYRAQTQPNGTTWTDWISMGGSFSGNVAVASNWDGRLQVFATGTNAVPYHAWQTQTDSSSSWSQWESLGGATHMDPAVGKTREGRLAVFVIGLDGALHYRVQVTAGGGFS